MCAKRNNVCAAFRFNQTLHLQLVREMICWGDRSTWKTAWRWPCVARGWPPLGLTLCSFQQSTTKRGHQGNMLVQPRPLILQTCPNYALRFLAHDYDDPNLWYAPWHICENGSIRCVFLFFVSKRELHIHRRHHQLYFLLREWMGDGDRQRGSLKGFIMMASNRGRQDLRSTLVLNPLESNKNDNSHLPIGVI